MLRASAVNAAEDAARVEFDEAYAAVKQAGAAKPPTFGGGGGGGGAGGGGRGGGGGGGVGGLVEQVETGYRAGGAKGLRTKERG